MNPNITRTDIGVSTVEKLDGNAKLSKPLVLDLSQVGADDVALVGGKCASLGELFRELTAQGVKAVDGFSTTSHAYNLLLETGDVRKRLQKLLKNLDVENLEELARVGGEARRMMLETPFPDELETAILDAYRRLCDRFGKKMCEVAVRSSATAEDLPDASFAGQQDTILNVRGENRLLEACRQCFASLWTDRAISYRQNKDFDHFDVALSVGVQPMVRSDSACSGVMFTLDTESGFREAVVINGAWGLGEAVVQGMATPDEWIVFKPTLKQGFRPIVTRKLGVKEVKMVFADEGTGTAVRPVVETQRNRFCLAGYEVLLLATWACQIEDHYSKRAGFHQPMDIEWAKDGITGELFILQARPETVHAQNDERNGAVEKMVALAIDAAKRNGKKIGICGQAPSDYPEFAEFLVERGINSISLNPDTVIQTTQTILETETRLKK